LVCKRKGEMIIGNGMIDVMMG